MHEGCRIVEHLVRGYRAVTLENDDLAATFLPEKGSDLYALVAREKGVDLLWKSPWAPRQAPSVLPLAEPGSEAAWLDQYLGGWQFIFPNGGDACTYAGARLGFHGEASVRAWDCRILRNGSSAVEVEFSLATSRGSFAVVRRIRLERGCAIIHFDESISNHGEQDLHYMWGHHPAFGAPFLDSGCRLTVPARRFLCHDAEISSHARLAPGSQGPWPVVPGKDGLPVDLSLIPPKENRMTEFGYITELDAGWYALQNDRLGIGFALSWPKEIFPFLWYWMELRGAFDYPWYGRSYVGAVEPFNSVPGSGLVKAIEHGTAPLLGAGQTVRAQLAAAMFQTGEVESVGSDGVVRLRDQ
ncbi:MAG: DUF4432 family protein [Bryobacterales bacterium]|nr:DUF4432 family protein [Bryobacterales bacterium]MEB2363238.1 DUF4432 family protein [Bryobacterales bacterium]